MTLFYIFVGFAGFALPLAACLRYRAKQKQRALRPQEERESLQKQQDLERIEEIARHKARIRYWVPPTPASLPPAANKSNSYNSDPEPDYVTPILVATALSDWGSSSPDPSPSWDTSGSDSGSGFGGGGASGDF